MREREVLAVTVRSLTWTQARWTRTCLLRVGVGKNYQVSFQPVGLSAFAPSRGKCPKPGWINGCAAWRVSLVWRLGSRVTCAHRDALGSVGWRRPLSEDTAGKGEGPRARPQGLRRLVAGERSPHQQMRGHLPETWGGNQPENQGSQVIFGRGRAHGKIVLKGQEVKTW